ncbi:DUF445 family protein [Deltaproteobacteria bacterium TL4]
MVLKVLDIAFRWLLLITVGVLGVVTFALPEVPAWVNYSFILSVTGNVGYFANYLFIAMLFHPKRGKVLGWSGLIPEYQPELAQLLVEKVESQMLDSQLIIDYIYENRFIEAGVQQFSVQLLSALNEPKNREGYVQQFLEFLQDRVPPFLDVVFVLLSQLLVYTSQNGPLLEKYWMKFRKIIIANLEDQKKREKLVLFVYRVLLKNIPKIAQLLNEYIAQYFRDNQRELGINLSKRMIFNTKNTEHILQELMEEPETVGQIIGVLDGLVALTLLKLQDPEVQELIISKMDQWRAYGVYVKETAFPENMELLQEFLCVDENWNFINMGISVVVQRVEPTVIQFAQSDKVRGSLKTAIDHYIQEFNIQQWIKDKVMSYDTNELEELLMDEEGVKLGVSRLFCGIFGMLIGTVLIHSAFFIPLLILFLTVQYSKAKNRKSSSQQEPQK